MSKNPTFSEDTVKHLLIVWKECWTNTINEFFILSLCTDELPYIKMDKIELNCDTCCFAKTLTCYRILSWKVELLAFITPISVQGWLLALVINCLLDLSPVIFWFMTSFLSLVKDVLTFGLEFATNIICFQCLCHILLKVAILQM